MSNPYISEIRMFGGNFAPRSYAFCDGTLFAIAQNSALFSLVGTIYGGDGRTTFGIPDLRGRIPMHTGTGPGLPAYSQGQKGGAENVTLTNNTIPSHGHPTSVSTAVNPARGDTKDPNGAYLARADDGENNYHSTSTDGTDVELSPVTLGNTGGGQQFDRRPPSLAINFIIALQGTYPS